MFQTSGTIGNLNIGIQIPVSNIRREGLVVSSCPFFWLSWSFWMDGFHQGFPYCASGKRRSVEPSRASLSWRPSKGLICLYIGGDRSTCAEAHRCQWLQGYGWILGGYEKMSDRNLGQERISELHGFLDSLPLLGGKAKPNSFGNSDKISFLVAWASFFVMDFYV